MPVTSLPVASSLLRKLPRSLLNICFISPAKQTGATWHQSPGKTWVRTDTIYAGPVSFLDLLWDPAQSRLLGLSDQACGQQWLDHVQVQQERLFEEPVRRHEKRETEKGGKQKWETSSLWQHLRKKSCFGYGWPHAFTPRRLTCAPTFGLFSCIIQLLLKHLVWASLCNQNPVLKQDR